ncbi:MAG: hypothetical protein ACXVYS_16565, partial [Oryzihumus sp.]
MFLLGGAAPRVVVGEVGVDAAAVVARSFAVQPQEERRTRSVGCHQKSFGAFKPVEQVLRFVPGLEVKTIESSCCGMAGAFGYGADTYQASIDMAELSLLPAVRGADTATLIIADGTS